ncbi:hypothetical protein [Bosea psychrotolerans]|uniref:Uncharacterized protein n=1 Tax=Bosea psychrotolerans TaxID=1871628 RepID=A0A2S4MEX8_9HYPH|nr:hypothetical protein [Bosea psychrotolerans]POR53310.1 hypothetical protein CYD53_104286 [Bosea psychrotolerans]
MAIVALGMPGQFTAWGFEALGLLLQTVNPGFEHRWIDRFDSCEQGLSATALVCSQFPSRSLRDAVLAQQMPIVAFTTSGAAAVCHQLEHHQGSVLEAVRTVGASVALLTDCLQRRRALILDTSDRLEPRQLLGAMARHLGVVLPGDVLEPLLASIGPLPPHSSGARPLSESEEAIVTLVLENAVAHLHDPGVPLKSIWPHRVFFAGDRPDEEAPLVADATGGSRVLYYGPYLHLSAGRWSAKLTLGFTKEAIGLPLKVSAFGPNLLGEARMRPRREGIFAAQFSFSVAEPEHPVEFHIRTEEGAIEGRVALGQVELTHSAAAQGVM